MTGPRPYGPHRPDEPANLVGLVTLRHNGKSLERIVVPLAPAVARQRRQINNLAWWWSRTGGSS